jgi:dienelactone hydrolase
MLVKRTRRTVLFSLCLLVALPAAAQSVAGGSASASAAAATRAAFLKIVDRPRVPLAAEARSLADPAPGLSAQHITFASDSIERVPTLLMKRQGSVGRGPAIIILHGTGGNKEGMSPDLMNLAQRGFVAVAMDGRYHGERVGNVPGPASTYENAILRAYQSKQEHPFLYDAVWDVMRLVDYLATRDDIDASRIGLVGFSKGGMETYLTAAIDQRIAVAVSVRGVQSFDWALKHNAWDSRAWTIRGAIDAAAGQAKVRATAAFVQSFYDVVTPGVYGQFDGPAMLPLIAPRPLLVINGDSDPRTPMAGVRLSVAAAEQTYRLSGAPERFQLHIMENTGHENTPDVPNLLTDWFVKWLQPRSN